ncbi:hypothetical protein BJV74DRAFT_395965 [Russula compacta]|nr:hypothetical protein BJV74DRAFT_395965 [Russula compacta]
MSSSSTSFRPPGQHPAAPQTRQPTYSSLGEALGTERPALPSYSQQPHPPSSSSLPMSSDGRYMYHQHQQQGMTSYDYSSYPHNSYDAPQFPQNHPRQPRSSQSHPPSEHVSYNPHQPHYHAPYGPAPYTVPHSAQPQWNGEAWAPFSQPVAPPASVQETPVPPTLNRPEPATVPAPAPAAPAPPSQRVYPASPQPQPHAETRRTSSGTPKAADPPSQPKRKPREKEVAAPRYPSPLASTPLDIDFGKLIESYRIIIDTTSALSNDPAAGQSRPPSLEALQRISQSAALGLRLLAPNVGTETPGTIPPNETPGATPGSAEEGDAAAKRQKAEAPVPEGQTCLGCNATSTPEWRRGPLGPRTLCNACGLVYAKLVRQKNVSTEP